MESTSIDIEHCIFKNSKTDIGYKTAILKKVIKLFPSMCILSTCHLSSGGGGGGGGGVDSRSKETGCSSEKFNLTP